MKYQCQVISLCYGMFHCHSLFPETKQLSSGLPVRRYNDHLSDDWWQIDAHLLGQRFCCFNADLNFLFELCKGSLNFSWRTCFQHFPRWWPKQQHVFHARYSREHYIQVQPPLGILTRLLRKTPTIDRHTSAYCLTLGGCRREKIGMRQWKAYSPDSVCLRASPSKLCLDRREQYKAFCTLDLLCPNCRAWQKLGLDMRQKLFPDW